jgi:mono/diheme cytochrome c family protein
MNRTTVAALVCAGLIGLLSGLAVRSAHAVPEFKKAFEEKYVGGQATPAQKAIGAALKTEGCNACHAAGGGGKGKKPRNAYGDALHDLGLRKGDKKNLAKIRTIMKEAESKKTGGESVGDRLKEGKLPK